MRAAKRSRFHSLLSLRRQTPPGGCGAPKGLSESSLLNSEGGRTSGHTSSEFPSVAAAVATAAAEKGASCCSSMGSAAAATAATTAAAKEGSRLEEGETVYDSDDSELCAASLAALSVGEAAAGGAARGSPERRAFCLRAGNRLHVGLPPESYELCKQQ